MLFRSVTFLTFGKIKPYKGVDTLIAALARVPRDLDQAWRVRVVGQPYMDMAPLRDGGKGGALKRITNIESGVSLSANLREQEGVVEK